MEGDCNLSSLLIYPFIFLFGQKYLDPRNPVQAFMEAKNIMSFIDDNHDGMLSMEEILRHKDIFISSKVMNFAANVHDEF